MLDQPAQPEACEHILATKSDSTVHLKINRKVDVQADISGPHFRTESHLPSGRDGTSFERSKVRENCICRIRRALSGKPVTLCFTITNEIDKLIDYSWWQHHNWFLGRKKKRGQNVRQSGKPEESSWYPSENWRESSIDLTVLESCRLPTQI